MNLTYVNPGFEYSLDSILLFQTEETAPYWSDALLYFYPQIDPNELRMRDIAGRREYLRDALAGVWAGLEEELSGKVALYNEHFARYRVQIEAALSQAFDTDASALFNDLKANITLNPVCPRFLRERRFDVFYKNSERGALGISIHEMIHFIWFFVWHERFTDSYAEYESPSLKWILSEMVVESIMRDERLSAINPYFPREAGGCVYDYFPNMEIEGEPALAAIDRLYRANSIGDFMEKAYGYCLKHEDAIRAHIARAEEHF